MSDSQRIADIRGNTRDGWRDKTEQLEAAYHGGSEWLEFVRYFIRKIYQIQENIEAIDPHLAPINITERIVTELASVYEVEPERTLTDTNGEPLSDDDQARYKSILEEIGWDSEMQHVERQTVLLNNCVVYLAPDYDNSIAVDTITCPDIEVIQDLVYPSRFDRSTQIDMFIAGTSDSWNGQTTNEKLRFTWDYRNPNQGVQVSATDTNGAVVQLIPGLEKYSQVKGYPLFLARPDKPPRGEVFNDVPLDLLGISYYATWRDAARAFITARKEMEPYLVNGKIDLFKQANSQKVMTAPHSFIFSDEGPVTNLEWNPKTAEYMAGLVDRLKRFAQARHLPMSFSEMIVAQSGVAKFWDEAPRRAYRQRRMPYWKDFERSAHAVLMQTAKAFGMDVSQPMLDSRLQISFPSLPSTMSPLEHVQYVTAQIDKNLMSRAEAIAELRGVDTQEAEALAAEILQGNKTQSSLLTPRPALTPPENEDDADIEAAINNIDVSI
jgi:hypothetical protein